MSDPLTKIYITSDPLQGFVVFLFAFLLRYLPTLAYNKEFDTLARADKKVLIDGAPLVYVLCGGGGADDADDAAAAAAAAAAAGSGCGSGSGAAGYGFGAAGFGSGVAGCGSGLVVLVWWC